MGVRAIDEGLHEPGDGRWWSESHYLDWFTADGSLGGYVRIGVIPAIGRAWYWACVVGPGRPLVTVIDHDVPLPPAGSLEVRADGLWADVVVEEPVVHVAANLEAFALRVDDPWEVSDASRGDRVPFGLELDWVTDRATFRWPEVQDRYEIPCRVEGRVVVGDEELEIAGWGQRDHSWGERDWWTRSWCWSAGRLDDGARWHTTGAVLPGSDWGVAYWLPGGGDAQLVEYDEVVHRSRAGRQGVPELQTLTFGAVEVTLEPVAIAPVLIDDPFEGRHSRFPRALCRATASDGRSGWGWVEWNQPASPAASPQPE